MNTFKPDWPTIQKGFAKHVTLVERIGKLRPGWIEGFALTVFQKMLHRSWRRC